MMFVKKLIAYGGIALMMVLMLARLWMGAERWNSGFVAWTFNSWVGVVVLGVILAIIFGSFYILFLSRT